MIEKRREARRGCGWRKPGGLYLVASGLARPCGKLPIPLIVCPTCGGGIKPSRGWTWVNGTALIQDVKCEIAGTVECAVCPLSKPPGRVGLLWIGEAYYKTPMDFTRETKSQGVSRRIPAVPRDFELGKTWVWLAHRKAIENPDATFTAGVFQVFKPTAVEYVVKGDETEEELEKLEKRGITPVEIERVGETADMFEGERGKCSKLNSP